MHPYYAAERDPAKASLNSRRGGGCSFGFLCGVFALQIGAAAFAFFGFVILFAHLLYFAKAIRLFGAL